MSEKDSTPAAEKGAPAPSEKEAELLTESPPPPSLQVVPAAVKSKIERRVFWACIWSLVALGLIVWSLVDPKPIPVIVAMSVGQVIGTLALLLFVGSVLLDLRARYKIERIERKAKTPPAAE